MAGRLESTRPEEAARLYGYLAESEEIPREHAKTARRRLEALQGGGEIGSRAEFLLARLFQSSFDYRIILPMVVASTVAGLARASALSRLLGGSTYFSRGLPARLAAGSLAFGAEVPTFVLGNRALQATSGSFPTAPLSREWASAALSLAGFKAFSALGGILLPSGRAWSGPLAASVALYTLHHVEEKLGWRPESDVAGRIVDALAETLNLSIGARMARGLLGEGFAQRQAELTVRAKGAWILSPKEIEYIRETRFKVHSGRAHRSAEKDPAECLRVLLLHYRAKQSRGQRLFHILGDHLILKALAARPQSDEDLKPWQWRIIHRIEDGETFRAPLPPTPLKAAENGREPPVLGLAIPRKPRPATAFPAPTWQVWDGRLSQRPPGWVRWERAKIISTLKRARLKDWEKVQAVESLVDRLEESHFPSDVEIGEAAKLYWEISTTAVGRSLGRDLFEGGYLAFLDSERHFPTGSPQVYRETLRLRRIFSDPQIALQQRLRAVDATVVLFEKFSFQNAVADGEARMILGSLEDFLREETILPGSREQVLLNSGLSQIRSILRARS